MQAQRQRTLAAFEKRELQLACANLTRLYLRRWRIHE
jgi:hypothetical protein